MQHEIIRPARVGRVPAQLSPPLFQGGVVLQKAHHLITAFGSTKDTKITKEQSVAAEKQFTKQVAL